MPDMSDPDLIAAMTAAAGVAPGGGGNGLPPGWPAAPPPVVPHYGNSSSDGDAGAGDPVGNTADAAGSVADDVGTVLPRPEIITLVSGRQVRVKKLKTRELLGLLAIGIGGVGPRLADLKLDPREPTAQFVAKFAGLIISAFPYAVDETMAFLRLVVEPVGLVTDGRIDKAVKARNDALDAALDAELANPEPDDTITIIEAVARNNAGDLQTWGKRLAGIWTLASRTGQIPPSPTSQG